jgi:hypothetical protein
MFPSHGQDAWSIAGLASHLSRRELRTLGIAAGPTPAAAFAGKLPSKPIRFMVGATPGGSIDHGARVRAAFQKVSATASTMADPEQFQKYVAAGYLRCGRPLRERNVVIGA